MLKKIILLLLVSISIRAQISTYNPLSPTPSSKVIISYNPFVDSAKFSINDDVYAIIWQHTTDGEYSSKYQKLIRDKNVLSCDIIIDTDAALYTVRFITLSQNAWDITADLKFMVIGQDGKSVRNAHCANMDFDNYENESRTELLLYPDNYSVYRTLWFNYKFQKPEEYRSLISKELLKLEEIKENSSELLYSKAYGNILLHQYEKALKFTKELVTNHQKKSYTSSTLSSFLYELETSNDKSEFYQQIKKIVEEYALANIELETVWDFVASLSFSVYSDSCIQKVCEYWLTKQPDNPSPYYYAGIVFKKKSELVKAEQYYKNAIDLILKGKLRLYSDISGKSSSRYLGGLYYGLSDIKYQLSDYGEALEAIKASQTVMENPYHKLFQLEGDIWFTLKNYVMAEKAYLEALKKGLPEAKNNLQKCYEKTHNTLDGFELYLTTKLDASLVDKKYVSKKAPDFNLTDIHNVNYSLKELKGKVIVMNFWFTGCGPCKQEIPALNELVNNYKNKNVLFIAFALDDDLKILNIYLKKTPFDYVIIPKASQVAKDYKITLYPSHIIVDKKGNIVTTIEGGSDKIGKEISAIIDNQLRN